MRALVRSLDAFWYMKASASQLAHVRLLVGGFTLVYLLVTAPNFLAVAEYAPQRFTPLGIVALLASPLPPLVVKLTFGITLLVGAAFALGFRYRWSGPLFAVLLLAVTSYRTSWGMCFHTDNLMTLHVLVLAVAPAADALSLDARARRARLPSAIAAAPHGRYGWSLRAAGTITVICYVLAGVAKLVTTGWPWLSGAVLQNQIATDNLRKIELGALYSPLGALLAPHQAVFGPLAVLTLVIELGAPVALFGGRVARGWIVLAALFHWGVLALMAIVFPYQLTGIAFVTFLRPDTWRVLGPLRRWFERPVAPRGEGGARS
jgi:hypothetical protein